jgi:two-component system, cell cycle sensor histidine kinase and response regulator CckA
LGPRETSFAELLMDAPVPLATLEKPGKITACNAAFEQLPRFHSSPKPAMLVDLVPPENQVEVQHLVSELFRGDRDCFQIESRTSGAEVCALKWTVWQVRAGRSATDRALLMVEDLSGIAMAEQRLRQAERLEAVGRLAGGVAHDFNNVLTGVLLYCDLLISVLEPTHRGRTYAEEIRKAGIQATGLVRQLLSVARPTKLAPRPISLNEIVEGMRNLLTRLIGDHIELKLRLDPGLGLVRMDPAQAQQILLNLVLNARDALPQGGKIAVETGNCQDQILSETGEGATNPSLPCALFTVLDNGHGMDESVSAHLFEPFFTTKAGKGTGIGLATVHDIIATNDGLIHVESKPGCGTRIGVLLPLIPDTAAQPFPAQSFHPANHADLLSFQAKDSTL